MPIQPPDLIVKLPSWFENKLVESHSSEEANAIGRIVLEELSGREMVALLADQDGTWSKNHIIEIDRIISALKANEPIQYILGFADFMDLRFAVEPGVLIPRGETEELIVWIVEALKEKSTDKGKGLKILDIGCGSGIIGICLAKEFPEAEIICADLHPAPLKLTKENARNNEVNVEVMKMDALNPSTDWQKMSFNVIVSNPPYITESQKKLMNDNVLEYEPEIALFVQDNDPLIFYREIGRFATMTLAKGGLLYFEINEELGNETKSLLDTYFQFVEVRKDIHNRDRMIKAQNGY